MLYALLVVASLGCGSERWDVKTASDAAAKEVKDGAPLRRTVAELAALPAPKWSASRPRGDEEKVQVELEVYVRKVRAEADGDVHVVVADAAEGGPTMVVEVPSDECAEGSRFREEMKAARAVMEKLAPGRKVLLRGVLFFDKLHGAYGAAGNGAEVHPVTKAEAR